MSRIVSWNLNERPPGKPAVWNHMSNELGADVAVVQEAVVPPGSTAAYRPDGVAARDGGRRPWGSAVVALSDAVQIRPIFQAEGVWRGRSQGLTPLDCVDRGHVAVALVDFPDYRMTVVSAYGLIEFGYAGGTLLRTLADLEPLLDDPELGRDVLLAGDWNIGTWWSGGDSKYARRQGGVLELLKAYGLIECLDRHLASDRGRLDGCGCELGDACRHIETFRKPGRDVAYMDDYVFATPALADRMTYAGVAPGWDWTARLSDHAPLMVDLP